MVRRIFLFALPVVAGLFLATGLAPAQEGPAATVPNPSAISTSASPNYPEVTCTSADALACADTLQLASDTRDQLSSLLMLGRTWRFAVHIHVMAPDDPLLAKVDREAAAVFAQGATMRIEAVLPSSDPDAREFIQRQFVTALLWEKFFANTTSFGRNTRVDVIPLWLVEGLREWLNEDSQHDRERIVERAVRSQAAPTLAEVTGWHDLSDDRLLGLWQRAFCYYLVDSLVQQGAPRDDFQQWLASFSAPHPSRGQLHFPTETGWQRELVDAADRSHDIVYTWAETLSKLTAAETVTFAASKDAKVQTCMLAAAASIPRSPALMEALQERLFAMTKLELRAHPSWHSILELYRSGLVAMIHDDRPGEAEKLFQEAHRQRVAEADYHQKLLDYVNWFDVTRNYENHVSRFESYFTTAQEMEKVEGDPSHPNLIRANLLEIESEL